MEPDECLQTLPRSDAYVVLITNRFFPHHGRRDQIAYFLASLKGQVARQKVPSVGNPTRLPPQH